MTTDERLREALARYAEGVEPERGAWTEIVGRLDEPVRRRRAIRWVLPAAAAVAVAAAVVWLASVGGGSGEEGEQVAVGPDVASTLVATTADDRLVELDARGNELREIADLAAVDASLGIPPGRGRPDRPQVAVDPSSATAYVTREAPFVGHCPGDPDRLSIVVAVDLASGAATHVAGGSTTSTVSASSPAVSPSGVLAYLAQTTTTPTDDGPQGSGCESRWGVAVRGDGLDETIDWPLPEQPPTGLSWLSDSIGLVATSDAGDQVRVESLAVRDGLRSHASLDLHAPAAASAAVGAGVVLAGSADWEGLSLEHEVWFQPSVDPPPDFDGGLAEFVRPLFDLPARARPTAVSASDGLEWQRIISDVGARADALRASADRLRQQVAEIDEALGAGSVPEGEAASISARRTDLERKADEYEMAAIELDLEGDLVAQESQERFLPAVAVTVEDDAGVRSVLVWTSPDVPLVEVSGIEAVAWMPSGG